MIICYRGRRALFELQDGIGWTHRTQRTIQIGEAQSMLDSCIQNQMDLLEVKLPYEPVCPSVGQLVVQLVVVSVIIS